MNTTSHFIANQHSDLITNPEIIEAIKWIHSLQDLLGDCETKIYTGEYTSIEPVLDRILHHAVFTAIRKLELLGYYDNNYDDLLGK